MFCPWPHGRISIQCQWPAIIFKYFTQGSWWNFANIISQGLHFFYDIYDSTDHAQCLTECNVLFLSRSDIYLYLKFWLPYKWTPQILHNKSQAITCHIWIILEFFWKPITAEVIIRSYLDVAVVRADICPFFQFPSSRSISSCLTHHVVLLNPWIIAHIGAPRMQCLVGYYFLSS